MNHQMSDIHSGNFCEGLVIFSMMINDGENFMKKNNLKWVMMLRGTPMTQETCIWGWVRFSYEIFDGFG